MITNIQTATQVAELLLQIKAIKLNSKNPFTWASGWQSPIYCDNRLILSYPNIRKIFQEAFVEQVISAYGKPDVIAGVATGAIGMGILVAEALELPFVYVRPEPKKHGRQNQVEGELNPGQSVVVIEDLISTGKSSLLAAEALLQAGANIKGMSAIFTYGFPIASENFLEAGITLNTLSDYSTLLNVAVQKEYISETELDTLKQWSKNPSEWKTN